MKEKIVAVTVVGIVFAGVVAYLFLQPQKERGIESTVARVIDGDTIQLANGDKVRLVGIDAPEHDQPYYDDVTNELKKLEGKVVRMEKDSTNKDRYGRYLRYIFLGDHFINLELLQSGMVYAYVVNPDRKYEKEFLEAENYARANKIGIWRTSDYSNCIELEKLNYNAKGEDDKNVNGEFFIINNSCKDSVSMKGWTVRNTFNSFKIPDFNLDAGYGVKIISGKGENSREELFLSSTNPVWNNKGDVLYLRDDLGRIILSESYKNS